MATSFSVYRSPMTADSAPAPASLDDLLAIEAIKQLKYRYFRFLDQNRWEEMADLLTPEVAASYGGGAYAFTGRDDVIAFLERSMGRDDFLSSHRAHHPEITLVSATTATGIWAFDDEVIIGEHGLVVRGSGFYDDAYVRSPDGAWRIARTGYRRSFEQIFPVASIAGWSLTASWWGTDGRSTLPAG